MSGRDTTAVQKTVSGLIKLVSPNPDTPVPDEVLEWALRIGLECRRRVSSDLLPPGQVGLSHQAAATRTQGCIR